MLICIAYSCGNSVENDSQNIIEFVSTGKMNDDVILNKNEYIFENNIVNIEMSKLNNSEIVEQNTSQLINSISYKMRKISTKYYLINKGIKGDELESSIHELENEQLYFFELEDIARKDLLSTYFENDSEGIQYFSFDIINNFYLVDGEGDTLKALYANYVINGKTQLTEKVLLSFPKLKKSTKTTLIYRDNVFNNQIVKFSFPSEIEIENNYIEIL